MKFVIETARDQHLVRDEPRLRKNHADHVAAMIRRGSRALQLHDVAGEKRARINHGVWLFDCDCGAGVAVDPEFASGYCFGCGAIHSRVVFPNPGERAKIERILLKRPKAENRNWEPTETATDLAKQNAEHKVDF